MPGASVRSAQGRSLGAAGRDCQFQAMPRPLDADADAQGWETPPVLVVATRKAAFARYLVWYDCGRRASARRRGGSLCGVGPPSGRANPETSRNFLALIGAAADAALAGVSARKAIWHDGPDMRVAAPSTFHLGTQGRSASLLSAHQTWALP